MEKNINVIIGEKYRQEEPAKTAYNKQYALRALFAPSKTAVATLCAVFSHPHSSPPQACGLLYQVGWNVAYLERYAKWKAKIYCKYYKILLDLK